MSEKSRSRIAGGIFVLGLMLLISASAKAGPPPDIDHILLLSIDGMHAIDLANCANGISGVNSGNPYCPNLAALMQKGVNYTDGSTSKPSDSFPGLMTIVSGASPGLMGIYYDHAYDRSLNPPVMTTGNGNPGGSCTKGVTPTGTQAEYEEGIDINQAKLNGGAPSGDGGVNSINRDFLSRDQNCVPVYPWNYVRVNTVFGVIHQAGGYTAWADKHPSYSSVGGPSGAKFNRNVNDYYGPEINSLSQDYTSSDIVVPTSLVADCSTNGKPTLPDQGPVTIKPDDYTVSFQNIQCYDGIKVQAILNEIAGKTHNATPGVKKPVPTIFGMNFQAVSIGQKLIYPAVYGTPPSPFSVKGGYLDAFGTPSPSLLQEIIFVDNSIGAMVAELKSRQLYRSTLIIITAKHGQSPIDSARYIPDGDNSPATILTSFLPAAETGGVGATEDDVSLLWLTDPTQTSAAVAALEAASPALPLASNVAGIGEIFAGPAVNIVYNGLSPKTDPRTPDIIVSPNVGVTYSNSKKKQAEHGGFSHDDTNVILLVSNPAFHSRSITSPVETAQVAPTILAALGLNPNKLEGVVNEGTQVLPGLPF